MDDNCYHAQLVNAPGLNPLAEGETVEDLLKAFASLVNDYLKPSSDAAFRLVQPRDLVAS